MRAWVPYALLGFAACSTYEPSSLETYVIIDEATSVAPAESAVPCGAGCPKGSFCSDKGFCASAGPIACPGVCAKDNSCGPFTPGCKQNGCTPAFSAPVEVQKLISLSFLPGNIGCDFDGDIEADNEWGSLLKWVPSAHTRLRESVETGRTNVLFQIQEHQLSFWFGRLAEDSRRCNPALEEASCRYTVQPTTFDLSGDNASCTSWANVARNATNENSFTASQVAATNAFLPMEEAVMLLKLQRPVVHARWTSGTHGRRLTDGMVCLAVLPGQLRLALSALNPDILAELGGLESAQRLFDSVVHPDLDLDGDGRNESLSVALGFETTPALARGLTKTASE